MKQNPWACLRAEFAIRHSRCALAFAIRHSRCALAFVIHRSRCALASAIQRSRCALASACALTVPWLAARPIAHPIAHTAKSPVTLDDCKTEKYNRIANEFNILI